MSTKMSKLSCIRIVLFWALLVGFFVWDWHHAQPVNLRLEAPIIAIGSGQAPSGGHCSIF
ncbi:hypothetical protein CBP31_08240 [Oceanisphaera profunda]|uniref:Uncharacterized protein n=1 Tax=Oceanisphaera profunda TaxID=1416627 RepID=A0A1Y0D4Z6_9GAMM|nr:hypothetical protein [Oceanisphaera profunda]ART82611.1 hypothetical protein CBP31_08240 [Oceanisphaera profunda]